MICNANGWQNDHNTADSLKNMLCLYRGVIEELTVSDSTCDSDVVFSPDPACKSLVRRNRKVWLRKMKSSFANQIQER